MNMYTPIVLIAAIFFAAYISFILINKKDNIFYYLLPFFIFLAIPIFRIDLLNAYTFMDFDLISHQWLMDMTLNKDLFRHDEAMQFLWKIYPRGYHILLSPFVLLGISMPIISKFIALLSGLAVPWLFYRLALVIFVEKRIAYFCALFSYALIPLYAVCFRGVPSTLGFLFYLITLIFFFKYLKCGSLAMSFYTGFFLVLTFFVHFVSFALLVLPMALLLTLTLARGLIRREPGYYFPKKGALVLGLIIICMIYYWSNNYRHPQSFGSPAFIVDKGLTMRVPFWFKPPSFWVFIKQELGFFPAVFSILACILIIFKKSTAYRFQKEILFVAFSMLVVLLIMNRFDKFYFLCGLRHIPYLIIFLYLSALPVTVNEIISRLLRNRFILVIVITLSLVPVFQYINWRMRWPVGPYGIHRIIDVPLKPEIKPWDEINRFKEILAVGNYLGANTDADTVVATPMWCGDLIRLYSKRNVTSSWEIGGLVSLYEDAGNIYLRRLENSQKLHGQPDYLYHKYKATYFIFDKDTPELLKAPSIQVFSTENFRVRKIIE